MPLIKHIEFKPICDNCYGDLDNYVAFNTKREARKYFKKQGVISGESMLCDECKVDADSRKPKPLTGREFDNAKVIDVFEMISKENCKSNN